MTRFRFAPVAFVTAALTFGMALPMLGTLKAATAAAKPKPPKDSKAKSGKPAAKAATKPAAKPTPKPVARPVAKPAAKPAAKVAAVPTPTARPAIASSEPVPTPAPKPDAATTATATIPAPPPRAPRLPSARVATASAAGGLPFLSETPPRPASAALTYAPAAAATPDDVAGVKEALALVRRGRHSAATERAAAVRDPTGRKLVEWLSLRSDDGNGSFQRYADFIQASPGWPSLVTLRRRAEGQLWQEKRDAQTVLAFFGSTKPLSARGRLALANALLARGDQANAQAFVREAWHDDDMSSDLEEQVLARFGELLTRDDHKIRMDARLYDEDTEDGLRMATRLGGAQVAIARARIAVINKAANAGALLEQVPNEARNDTGYMFSRAQWLRRADRSGEAAQLMLSAPTSAEAVINANEWWIERRLIARKLLDDDNPQAAYRVARDAAEPTRENLRVEHHFTAGWIALRSLNDPITALRHFAQISNGAVSPVSLARGAYWMGRANEAAGRAQEAQQHFQNAARYQTAYYGQLARARLGHRSVAVRRPPELSGAQKSALRNLEIVRAVELLYAAGERDLVIPFVADVADKTTDIAALSVLAEVTSQNNDPRATLHIGKAALGRGFALDHYAFPSNGIPKFDAPSQAADRSVVFAIARQESMFNPRAVSTAKAMGLMQVTAGTGKIIARKIGVPFDQRRLLNDASYNAQMGAAELGDLIQAYDGNYILVFVGYNAGRGRARQWIERFGDPRDPAVDPIDWVERIPFSETRNYVQRVMENMQIYKSRFGTGAQLTIEADLRGSRGQ